MQAATFLAMVLKLVTPFIDDQTLMVIRIDVTRLNADADARSAAYARLFAGMTGDENGSARAMEEFKRGIQALAAAGGKEAYLIVNTEDLFTETPFLVLPLPPGAQADRLAALLAPPAGSSTGRSQRPQFPMLWAWTAVIREAVVAGTPAQTERVRKMTPAKRPDLAKAQVPAQTADFEVFLIPTPDSRRVVAEMLPTLPKVVGGGPSTVLTNGVFWAALYVDGPPKMRLQLIIQSTDEVAAQALLNAWPALFRRLVELGVAGTPNKAPDPEKVKSLLTMLTPQLVRGNDRDVLPTKNRLMLDLNADQIETLLREVVAAGIQGGRDAARRAESANYLKQIGIATFQYAAQHNGAWPENLKAIQEAGQLPDFVLTNPRRPQRAVGYIYIKPTVPQSKVTGKDLLAYEAYDRWPGILNVLYGDGHVEAVSDEAAFEKMLAASEGKTTTTAPVP